MMLIDFYLLFPACIVSYYLRSCAKLKHVFKWICQILCRIWTIMKVKSHFISSHCKNPGKTVYSHSCHNNVTAM